MKTTTRKLLHFSLALFLLLGLLGLGPLLSSRVAQAAPAGRTTQAALPATTCTETAPGTRTCELWARTGTLTLPDATAVSIWGYTDQVTGTAQLPGPALIVNQAETVSVILHNELAETTALAFPGQDIVPDLVGIAPGGTATYTFVAANPGTYSYEAGLTANGARQVAMGLYGALIVRPAGQPTWVYNDPATAFDDESLLVLSEIDPALNADPVGFNMVEFAPQYWLLNGAGYPDTAPIATDSGRRVLLRQLNLGVQFRSLGILGLHQTLLGRDGRQLPYAYSVVAETIAAGESLDFLVTMPLSVPSGMRYALYETSGRVHNGGQLLPGNAVAFGGLLTFLEVPAGPPGPDTLGPLVSDAMIEPHVTAGAFGITLTAMLSEMDTGGAAVVAAEYFTDTVGAPGTGVSLAVSPAMMVTVTTHIPPAVLAGLPAGVYIYYLRGQDALGNWGPVGSASFHLATDGPMITNQYLTPNPSNGTSAVAIQATGDARPAGPANVVQAEYSIDTMVMPGMGMPMSLNIVAPVSSLTATIAVTDVAALAEGLHVIYIDALDSLGNWGMPGTTTLVLDKTGPAVSNIVVWPTPNNGYRPILPSLLSVRLEGLFSDPLVAGANSWMVQAEGFIDSVGADGSGFPLVANDGVWDEMSELGYVHIPLLTIRQLDPGPHTLYLHGKDVAGNWGPTGSTTLIIDKIGPDVTALDVQPNPTGGSSGVTLTGTLFDSANPGGAPASNLAAAEWFEGPDPGAGMGTPVYAADSAFDSPSEQLFAAISVIGWRPGDHTLLVRGQDEAGNWGPTASIILTVRGRGANAIFADGFEAGNTNAWSQAIGAVSVVPDAAMSGTTLGLAAAVNGTAPAYVVDTTPHLEGRYWAFFYFNPNGTDTAGGHHDILAAYDGRNIPIFGVQYEHNAGGGYELRLWVRTTEGLVFGPWYEVDNAAHRVEVMWTSDPATTAFLLVDGVQAHSLVNLDTMGYLLEEVRLGPSTGLLDGMTGVEYLDEFTSIRAIFSTYLPLVTR